MSQGHRRRIRNFLLDPKMQLRYTLFMVALSSLLTTGLGYIWYRQMRETSMTVEVKALASMDVDSNEIEDLRKDMKRQDNWRLGALVLFGVLFALVLAGYGIILTHKIAGPLFKISRHMQDVKEGELKEIWNLRKGDQLQEFFAVFKDMHTALREREQQELNALTEVIGGVESQLASTGGADEADKPLATLREIRDQKERRLKGEG